MRLTHRLERIYEIARTLKGREFPREALHGPIPLENWFLLT